MKPYPFDMTALRAAHAAALAKNFGDDAAKMLEFMCRNVWQKARQDDGQSYLAFGPYWWAVKSIIERNIGSQWGDTEAANPLLREAFMVRAVQNADALTLLLADEYRRGRLESFGVSPHHEIDGEEEGEDEYTLEDADMIRLMLS